ncbi:MAG TPA: type II CAAX endopeptidase family protein [Mariniphaga sp.]|nr:type II CAAX endopeptidase family protein [Mariniphaga sp.]
MQEYKHTYYPTILQAVHLIILYLFIQTVVDFPLAMIDYYNGTDYLYNPVKKVLLNIGSTLFILIYGIRRSALPIKEIFPLNFFNPLIILPLITFFWGTQNLLEEVNIQVEKILPAPPWFWELFSKVFESDFGWWGAFFRVVVVAPVIEELIFRGIILSGLRKNYPAISAVFISAVLFSLFHLNPWQMPATFILGLILGWIMIRTRNIILAIIGHSINNLLVLLTMTYWKQINTHAIYLMNNNEKYLISGMVLLFSIILMYLTTQWPRTNNPKP